MSLQSDFFSKPDDDVDEEFDLIRIGLASPESIRSWSYGEVSRSETINYRTFKPEKGGLFCSRIFGPVKDYECLCGKYKRIKYKDIVCDKCGVEVTLAKVRRERMAHIDLASPVSHIWFLKSLPSRICTLLDITLKDLEKVLYFESHIVIDPGLSSLSYGSLMSDVDINSAEKEFGNDAFQVGIGGEAIEAMLKVVDLNTLRQDLQLSLKSCNSELKRKKTVKRLKLVQNFLGSNNKPEWMMITCLPVLPPELRPLVMLEGERFATSDLNDLYRRVINRNNRLKRLLELHAPEIILRNEKRMLQESVDALLDNSRGGKIARNASRAPLKSLGDMLKGKQGRFRQNLLGKRVDYSARSVIVVGPNLKLHECGLPKKMAMELFKPFVYSKLTMNGIATTMKSAKKMVDLGESTVWDVLEEVIREHPVLLNRAPTLHRLSIQAFDPILVEGNAIHLHPLVCSAFNADFDGDQMSVHVPLSVEAQLEARVLMMSTNNILNLSNGQPVILPSKDIILGLYYLTFSINSDIPSKKVFASMSEVEYALEGSFVTLHTKILFLMSYENEERVVETTPGRLLFFKIVPKNHNITFDFVNVLITKSVVSSIMKSVYRYCGNQDTVLFADNLVSLGFKYSCKSGISFGMDDMLVPSTKKRHIDESVNEIEDLEHNYQEGVITYREKYNKAIDIWSKCTKSITEDLVNSLEENARNSKSINSVNSIYIMSDSGAGGSAAQIKQISGMRGLMAKPSGEIIETPITSNFKEGLSVREYFNSTHGAIKGLADTALKTANSGYLTRRLVDVALDVVVSCEDCGTNKGLDISNLVVDGDIVVPFSDRIIGRVSSEDIVHPVSKKLLAQKNTLLEEDICEDIVESGLSKIHVRSVLTCNSAHGVCAKCYGRDLSSSKIVSLGEAVGVIAAQSIGEPGTQLTLRTFHIGGAASRNVASSFVDAEIAGVVNFENDFSVINSEGSRVVLSKSCVIHILDKNSDLEKSYKIPYGSILSIDNGSFVSLGQRLANWDAYKIPILSEKSGKVCFNDIISGTTLSSVVEEDTGIYYNTIIDSKQISLQPRIDILLDNDRNEKFKVYLATHAVLHVKEGDVVKAGDLLASLPKEALQMRDIVGGLPRVAELVEARKPKDSMLMAEFDGVIEFSKDYKNKRRIILHDIKTPNKKIEYVVYQSRYVEVSDGESVRKGQAIVSGSPILQDLLRIRGLQAWVDYMLSEILSVYALQGVKIDGKHVEIVIKQMLQKIEVTDPGDTVFLSGEKVDKQEFSDVNQKIMMQGLRSAKGEIVVSGITKASTQTNSFISSAAFQETTRVLTEASIAGKVDELKSLKENVILGRLIPAGTGYHMRSIKKLSK